MEWSRGRVIGRGSTATVSLATSLASGEIFALKSSNLPLQREQSILSNLSSPYIVKYIGSADFSSADDTPMYNLCMEYAAGGNLTDLIRRRGGRLCEAEIGTTVLRILLGLEYLHARGLAHCDIKAQNILVDKHDVPIIGDFGCAKFVGGGGDNGVFSGTPAFMAPEVARGEEQGFAADVWAVGCTVIEMASGRIPWAEFGDNNPVSAIYRIGFTDASPAVPSWLSEEAKNFVSKCLIKEERERWSVKELLDHPFLDESKEPIELKELVTTSSSSPICVLDHGFWESLEGIDSRKNMTTQEICFSKIQAADRIKSLISGFPSNLPHWSIDDGWFTVRGGSDDSEKTEVEEQQSEENDGVFFGSSEFYGPLEDAPLFLEYSPKLNFDELEIELDYSNIVIVIVINSSSRRDGFVVGREFDDDINNTGDNSSLQKSFVWAAIVFLFEYSSNNSYPYGKQIMNITCRTQTQIPHIIAPTIWKVIILIRIAPTAWYGLNFKTSKID